MHRIERPSGEKRAWEIVSPFWETRDLGFFCKPSSRTANNCRIQSAPAEQRRPAVRRHIFQTPHSDGGCQLAIRAFPGHGTFHGTLAFPGPGDRIEELRRVRRPKRSRPASTVAAQASTLFQKGAMKIVCTLPWLGYATTTGMMTVVWRTLIDRTGRRRTPRRLRLPLCPAARQSTRECLSSVSLLSSLGESGSFTAARFQTQKDHEGNEVKALGSMAAIEKPSGPR